MINQKYQFLQDDYSNREDVLFMPEYIKKLQPQRGHLLDIGCGTGTSAKLWQGKWTGITGNLDEVREGTKKGLDILRRDAHNLSGIEDKIFDCFMMWDSLEHFVAPFIALSEAKRVLVNGGQGLIFMPGQNWLSHHNHIHVMTMPQMYQLLNRVGFKVLNAWSLFYPDNPDLWCDGMAVYRVEKDNAFVPSYSGGIMMPEIE
jgi:ubiquinone/menaquinone biosynthesis C-methylase UbiE